MTPAPAPPKWMDRPVMCFTCGLGDDGVVELIKCCVCTKIQCADHIKSEIALELKCCDDHVLKAVAALKDRVGDLEFHIRDDIEAFRKIRDYKSGDGVKPNCRDADERGVCRGAAVFALNRLEGSL